MYMTGFETSLLKQWEVRSVNDLEALVPELLEAGRGVSVWLLSGQMGSGKTTLTRAMCNFLGTTDNVSSPTFSIVNEYVLTSGDHVYHFDLYRLESLREAQDIGIEEYLDSGAWCLIEWPGVIERLLPDVYVVLELALTETGRQISLKKYENQN
jgi:tRNA threonylcarbamoyladenosine biosynthesis protein TsaE